METSFRSAFGSCCVGCARFLAGPAGPVKQEIDSDRSEYDK